MMSDDNQKIDEISPVDQLESAVQNDGIIIDDESDLSKIIQLCDEIMTLDPLIQTKKDELKTISNKYGCETNFGDSEILCVTSQKKAEYTICYGCAACGDKAPLSNDALLVKQFTEESTGNQCPVTPQKMTEAEVYFIIKMVFSEMAELAQTVRPMDPMFWLNKILCDIDLHLDYKSKKSDVEIIAEQGDAMVDAWYYMLNAAAKKGVNLSGIFNIVHAANMNKRHADGEFHRRDDGKVQKPANWQEPDINGEIQRQFDNGSW
jgi:predicted HAD superfamily Cof-like phosphohydrolase